MSHLRNRDMIESQDDTSIRVIELLSALLNIAA